MTSSIKIDMDNKFENPVLYVFLNKSLKMSTGKAAAQTAHAILELGVNDHFWLQHPVRTVIVLEAEDSSNLMAIRQYLEDRRVKAALVIDEGVNEIYPMTPTALATGVFEKTDPDIQRMFGCFKLYKDKKKFWRK